MSWNELSNRVMETLRTELLPIGGVQLTPWKLLVFAAVVVAALIASKILQRAAVRVLRIRGVSDEGSLAVVGRLLHYLILFVGIAIALEAIEVDLAALFAAGAVFAVAVGFAMQNIAQNFVSGLILLVERTIKPGDVLELEGGLVRVEQMRIRSTIVRTLDEEELIVPNALLVQSMVKSYTLRDSLYRLRADIGVVYSSDLKTVEAVLLACASDLAWRSQDRPPLIQLRRFGSSSVDFQVSVWIEDPWTMQRRLSQLHFAVWWALKEAGVVIAFPQLDVHFDPPLTGSLQRLAESA